MFSDSARWRKVKVTPNQPKPHANQALFSLTGPNFGYVKARELNFLPKCSKNNALFDHTVQLDEKTG